MNGRRIHVVDDIVNEIFDFTYYGKQETLPDRATLCSLALVCKKWSWRAQHLLFQDVVLQNRKDLHAFNAATTSYTEKGRSLSEAVRILQLSLLGANPVLHTATRSALGVYDLPPVLKRCPHLYELRLSLSDVGPIPDPIYQDLPSIPAIKSLLLSIERARSGEVAYLTLWPSVQYLEIQGELHPGDFSHFNRITDVYDTTPFRLRELRYGLRNSHWNDYQLWQWLLGGSADTLEILNIRTLPHENLHHLHHLKLSHRENLRSLHLPYDEISLQIAQSCPRLEEIFFNDHSSTALGFLSLASITRLPKTITHFGYVIWEIDLRQQVFVFLNTPRPLPNLHTITCCDRRGPSTDPNAYPKTLREAFAAEGITFRLIQPSTLISLSKILEYARDDCVSTGSFPRRISLANIRWMTRAVKENS